MITGVLCVVVVALAIATAGRHPNQGASAPTGASSTPTNSARPTTTTVPPTTTTTSVCEIEVAISGCPYGSGAAMAWARQQEQVAQAAVAQQAQAAQAASVRQAEQAYAECLSHAGQALAAQIAQAFGKVKVDPSPTYEPCSTAGLNSDQVQQVQQTQGLKATTQANG